MGLRGRGFDSSGQAPAGRGGRGEGVGSLSSKKTCQQNKILTNDGPAGPETPPPAPAPTPRRSPRRPAPVPGARLADPTRLMGWKRGAPRSQGPEKGPPAARPPQVQSIDMAPRGEGAPSARVQQPGRSGPLLGLASDPAPGRGAGALALRRGCGGWKERPVGGRDGRRGRPRARSGTPVAGAGEWSGGRARGAGAGGSGTHGLALRKRGDP